MPEVKEVIRHPADQLNSRVAVVIDEPYASHR